MPYNMRMKLLLIIISLLASAIDTIALTSDDPSPAPAQEDGVPPTQDETDTSSPDLDPLFATYKEADSDLIGADQYNIIFTKSIPDEDDTCRLNGYYDDKVLKTSSSQEDCFDRLRNGLNQLYAIGVSIYSDEYYYSDASSPYCAVECSNKSSASVLSSIQMSLVSVAFALLAFLALNSF